MNQLEAELFDTDFAHGFVARMPLDDLIAILMEAKDALKSK
ncbi:hypothetical protein J2X14_003908 [Pantoea alhagi]|nr:hypothetical protein [Pantoea alhagi]